MKTSPQEFGDKLNKIITAWEELAPAAVFFGMTLAQFKAAVAKSLNTRAEIAKKEREIAVLQNNRNDADVEANPIVQGVISGVKGDPNFGEDSDLYEMMGYVRKSEKASGLRKPANPTAPTPPA